MEPSRTYKHPRRGRLGRSVDHPAVALARSSRESRPLSRPRVVIAVLLMGLGACSASLPRVAKSTREDATASSPAPRSPTATQVNEHERAASESPAATAPSRPATKYTDSELGRALGLIDSDPRRAASALDALRERTSLIDDVLLYYGAVARAAGDPSGARALLERLLETAPASVLSADAAALVAEVVEKQADLPAAISLADHFGRNAPSGPSAARVCLAAGRLLVSSNAQRAAGYLECARAKAPQSANGRAGYEALTSLRASHPELRPDTAAALMTEARQLGREARSSEQIATLDRLFSDFPGSAYQNEAVLAYARALAASRGKSAAADYLEKHLASAGSASTEARWLYEAGTYRWNDNHDAEALTLFERMLRLHSAIAEEGEAAYALARIHDSAGRRAAAIAAYERAATMARGATRVDSQWRQGWVAYRAEDWKDAERRFASMISGTKPGSDDEGRAEALYWRARCLERLGRKQEAAPIYAQVLAEFPVGYYSLMAEKRLGRGQQRGSRPLVSPSTESSSRGPLPAAARTALDRADLLNQAGLGSLAARDLASRLDSFDAATRRDLLPALQRVGAYDAAFRIAADLQKNGRLSREEARPYLYPAAHIDIVIREAREAGIDPLLVFALMRQESAFAAHAVSPANALGLMQLLPSTADRMATQAGSAQPAREDLFEPSVNIRLGVRYLSELSRLFAGNTALMLAAYNAGENAAQRWQSLVSRYDDDEMIEQISYRETRTYVKSVLRNLRTYRTLYAAAAASVARTLP